MSTTVLSAKPGTLWQGEKNTKWTHVTAINPDTATAAEFLTAFLGSEHELLATYMATYSGKRMNDVLIDLAEEFPFIGVHQRTLKSRCLNSRAPIVLVEPARTVRASKKQNPNLHPTGLNMKHPT
jgi:hypothetical protein